MGQGSFDFSEGRRQSNQQTLQSLHYSINLLLGRQDENIWGSQARREIVKKEKFLQLRLLFDIWDFN